MTLLDKTLGRTPVCQREQLHDEAKSGGNQPANIRAINRRQTGSAPDSVLELTSKKNRCKPVGQETFRLLTTVSHIRGCKNFAFWPI